MSIKTTVGSETYERVREMLQSSFPGRGEGVPDETVDAIILALQTARDDEAAAFGLPGRSGEERAEAAKLADELVELEERSEASWRSARKYPLYIARARHHRRLRMASNEPFESTFMGNLPLVRVPLPRSLHGVGQELRIETEIGTVDFSRDHLAGSIEQIVDKYHRPNGGAPPLGYEPERVDLITPARLLGTRFAALAVYLGYQRASDAAPSFYMFEAGTALGEAQVLYFAAHMSDTITQRSGYKPTPFSTPNDTYHGWMTMNGDEPKQMVVQANAPNLPFYIEVTVDYDRVDTPDRTPPAFLTIAATARVAAIASSMGVSSIVSLESIAAVLQRI